MEVAPQKTDTVMLSGRKHVRKNITYTLDNTEIVHKSYVKYLGVYFDKNLTCSIHINETIKKITSVMNALRRLYRRMKDPCECKRRLLASVAISVIQICRSCLEGHVIRLLSKNCKESKHKNDTSICRAYRIALIMPVQNVAYMPPTELLAKQRAKTQSKAEAEKYAEIIIIIIICLISCPPRQMPPPLWPAFSDPFLF